MTASRAFILERLRRVGVIRLFFVGAILLFGQFFFSSGQHRVLAGIILKGEEL